jgi:hypothetical protein
MAQALTGAFLAGFLGKVGLPLGKASPSRLPMLANVRIAEYH